MTDGGDIMLSAVGYTLDWQLRYKRRKIATAFS
jgi:hypothetical protein